MVIDLTRHATLNRKRSILNRKAEPPLARLGRRRVWATLLLIALSSCFLQDYSVAADNYKPIHYKQYILIQLNDISEAYCLVELYSKENSKWDPKARNGSHIGIPQGRSKYLATVNGVKQIDWGIKYINNRYGSMCKALQHFKIKGWH
jgi:hypothetical protein